LRGSVLTMMMMSFFAIPWISHSKLLLFILDLVFFLILTLIKISHRSRRHEYALDCLK